LIYINHFTEIFEQIKALSLNVLFYEILTYELDILMGPSWVGSGCGTGTTKHANSISCKNKSSATTWARTSVSVRMKTKRNLQRGPNKGSPNNNRRRAKGNRKQKRQLAGKNCHAWL